MDIYHVIKKPVITEKGTHQSGLSHPETQWKVARGGAYTFEVHPRSTKPQIRQAVEMIYQVKVLSVRTSNRQGKRRRQRFSVGVTPKWKKAVVVLAPDHHIDLF